MDKLQIGCALGLILGVFAAPTFAQNLEPTKLSVELEQLRRSAQQGDYNAQRNLAYAYATGQGLDGQKVPKAACAWYLAIPYLNPQKLQAGDAGNISLYCQRLQPQDFNDALSYSVAIVTKAKK